MSEFTSRAMAEESLRRRGDRTGRGKHSLTVRGNIFRHHGHAVAAQKLRHPRQRHIIASAQGSNELVWSQVSPLEMPRLKWRLQSRCDIIACKPLARLQSAFSLEPALL